MDTQDHAGSSMNDSGTGEEIGTPLTRPRSPLVRGYVYFVQGGDAIKIGFSTNTAGRLVGLQTSNAEELELLGSVRGSQKDEAELHEMFCHLRLRGEWFRAEDELTDYIKSALLDEEWEKARLAPSRETLAAIKGLILQRRRHGSKTPIGYRHSNLIEQTRNYEHAEGEQRTHLARLIAGSVREIANLKAA